MNKDQFCASVYPYIERIAIDLKIKRNIEKIIILPKNKTFNIL